MSRLRHLKRISDHLAAQFGKELSKPAHALHPLECAIADLRIPAQCSPSLRSFASDAANDAGSGKWMPNWVKNKLPAALGGNREEISTLENLTLDDYAESLKQARRLGGLTGFASGTSASDPAAQGTLRLFETIIGAMMPEEKRDLSQFGAAERQRVATEAGCSLSQVDDCIARFLWMLSMTNKMAQLKKEGKAMPQSIEEVESMLGSWRQYKTEAGGGGGGGGNGGAAAVPLEAKGPKGQACPLAGVNVGKSTKCPLTRKSYKNCCGKGNK